MITPDVALTDPQRRKGHSNANAAMAYAHASRDDGRSIAQRMKALRATFIGISTEGSRAQDSHPVLSLRDTIAFR